MSVSLKSSTVAPVSYRCADDPACTTEADVGALPVKLGTNLRTGNVADAGKRDNKERKSRGRPRGTGGEGNSACAPPIRHHIDAHAKAVIQSGPRDDEFLLTTSELAAWLRVSPAWLEIGRSKKYGPQFRRLSSQVVRYRVADVKLWLLERQHAHTADYSD